MGKDLYKKSALSLSSDTNNIVQGYYVLFAQGQSVGEVWARLGYGDRKYAPDKLFLIDSYMKSRTQSYHCRVFAEQGRCNMYIKFAICMFSSKLLPDLQI